MLIGLLYACSWYAARQMQLKAPKGLAEVAAREAALDSLGDIAPDPANVTLADLQRTLRQPKPSLPGGHKHHKNWLGMRSQ